MTDIEKYKQLLQIYSQDKDLIELIELHFKLGSECLLGAEKERLQFETTKLMGFLEFKKMLLDNKEE